MSDKKVPENQRRKLACALRDPPNVLRIHAQNPGQIRDDDLLKYLVKPMREGVLVTCLMDCCHSGTVLDLPYNFIADGEHVQMERNENFDLSHLMNVAAVAAVAADVARMAASAAGASDIVGDVVDECCVIL